VNNIEISGLSSIHDKFITSLQLEKENENTRMMGHLNFCSIC